jgi:hypothetical protein
MCPTSAFGDAHQEGQHTATASEHFIPFTQVSKAAFDLASSFLHPAILNHSMRVYLYAKALAEQSNSKYAKVAAHHDLLFTACILHDIGTTKKYDGPQRFEVEGADATVSLLRDSGISEEGCHEVWMAIALHTSPGIAERINELSRLVRQGVLNDFGKPLGSLEDRESLKKEFEAIYPRLGAEKVLSDAVVAQAVRNPQKAPGASWPGNLYKAYLADPEWKGVNKEFF